MAETVHLYLKGNGADINGESSQTSLGREDSIECLSYFSDVITAREAGSGIATGRRAHQPIRILKRIDKSTPLIAKALCNNEVMEGIFKFFRPNPGGDGTTQHVFTVSFKEARVANQRIVSPNTISPALAVEPVQEEVSFIFHTIEWTYEIGGVSHVDSWRENQ
jgi:type VI secretion system secreted protein Hcp